MDEMICKECGKPFSLFTRNVGSLYCGDECRIRVRRRAGKANRAKRKERMLNGDKDLILKVKYKLYKQGATARNLIFALSKEEFAKHYNKPCHYCGQPVNGIGLDRKDNNIGYSIDNVLDCCTICNRMKHADTYEDFINKVKKINTHLTTKQKQPGIYSGYSICLLNNSY